MSEVSYLYEPEGSELHWDGLKPAPKPAVQQASLSGPAPSYVHPHDRPGMMGTSASQGTLPPTRPASPDDLLKQANAMLTQQSDQHAALMAAGPSTGNRDDAGGKIPDWLTKTMDEDRTDGLDI